MRFYSNEYKSVGNCVHKVVASLSILKSEYHASDPSHACVYILCLHSRFGRESAIFWDAKRPKDHRMILTLLR
jgi:hypothetical protein